MLHLALSYKPIYLVGIVRNNDLRHSALFHYQPTIHPIGNQLANQLALLVYSFQFFFLFSLVPCLPPDYLTFDVPVYSSLLVRWKSVLRHCRNGIILGYRLTYRELPNALPVVVNFTVSDSHYIIENMNMDANYTVEILAFTRIGNGNASYDLAQPDKMGK
jgi:hypothetical protein